MAGCSLINCKHALSNMAPSDLDSQYLREMLHGSWKWLIRIGTVCYPNILKFSLKNQNLIVTPHSSLWYLSTATSSRIQPQLDSMKSHSESEDTVLPQAGITRRVQCELTRSSLQKSDFRSCWTGKSLTANGHSLQDCWSPRALLQSTPILLPAVWSECIYLAGWLYGSAVTAEVLWARGTNGKMALVWEWTFLLAFVDPKAVWSTP